MPTRLDLNRTGLGGYASAARSRRSGLLPGLIMGQIVSGPLPERPYLCLEALLRQLTAALSAPLLIAGLLGSAQLAHAGPAGAAPAPSSSSTGPSIRSAPNGVTVTLITGDQVTVSGQGGRQGVVTKAADRGPGTAPVSFSTFVLRGDTYVLPSDAAAYAGQLLDWSLFDVSALIRGGVVDGAALPLAVTYQPGATPKAVPGLVPAQRLVPRAAPGAHPMSEEPAGAPAFGRLVAHRMQADAARTHSHAAPKAASQAAFAGIRSITLDSPNAAPRDPSPAGNAKPDPGFNMQTLSLTALTRDGVAPPPASEFDPGYFLVENVDHPDWFAALLPVLPTQNWSVPAGRYDVRAFIFTSFQKTIVFRTPDGPQTETVWDYNMSFVWQPQVTIQHDTTLHFDARTAKAIPLPATPDRDTGNGWMQSATYCCDPEFELTTDRVSPDGSDVPWYWESGAHALEGGKSGLEMFATPSTQSVSTGSRHAYLYFHEESPSTGHVYDLVYPSGGIPESFPTGVVTGQLAAIPTTYSSEVPAREGSQVRFGYQPWEMISARESNSIVEPLSRTEYVLATSASRSTLWQESADMFTSFEYASGDASFGRYTHYTPGPQPPVRWFDAPRHPGVEQPGSVVQPGDVVGGPMICPVCRGNSTLAFDARPYVNGDSSQWGSALDAGNIFAHTHIHDDESLDWYVDGSLAAEQTTATDPDLGAAATQLPMAAGSARYRLDYSVSHDTPWSSLSTRTDTRWDFESAAPKRSDALPAGWTCGPVVGKCGVVPLMLLDYSLPLDKHEGVAAPGQVHFTVHAYHQPHATTSATVNVPSVSISYDDGQSWQTVHAVSSLGQGSFKVTITTPDPRSITGFVSLRVSDSDSAGADVRQTLIRAFTLRGSAASNGAGVGTAPPPGGGGGPTHGTRAACAAAGDDQAACDAIVRTAPDGTPLAAADPATPSGYGPADLAAAYALPRTGGADQTVAVVDAAGDPNIVADLAAYREQYRLPPCGTDTGCLQVVDQDGTGPPPSGGNQGWGIETALDLDMVSAACPQCHLLLVVANTPSFDDLATAETTAAGMGADAISNSYGAYEQFGVGNYAAAYNHPGVAVVASSGDDRFGLGGTLGGTQFPASLPWATAVGGTRLVPDSGSVRGWSETAWADGGSGCSAYFDKPSWQPGANCHMRTVADVSAVADPDTGVAVYDTALTPNGGWLVVGGTSVAAPLIAGMYGLAGHAGTAWTPQHLYTHSGQLNDITSGTNGDCGSPRNYLCNARKGYDGPTGLGTPHGIGAF
jgi:hypothetical protein